MNIEPSGSPDDAEMNPSSSSRAKLSFSIPEFDPGKVGGGDPNLGLGFPPYPTNSTMNDTIEVLMDSEPVGITSRGHGRPPQKRRATSLSSPEASPALLPIGNDPLGPPRDPIDTSQTEDLLARAHDILVMLYTCPGLSRNDLAQALQSIESVRLSAKFSPLSRSDDPWMVPTVTPSIN